MAYTANTKIYNSNAVPGLLNGIGDSSIYDIDSNPKFAIGTGFKRQDGAIYRYANFVTATAQGLLVSPNPANVGNASTDALLVAPAAAYQQPSDPPGVYPGAVGSRFVYYTLASTVINQFAGGYLSLNKDTGYGYIYRIKSNKAAATVNSVANLVLIELYEPLQVAIDATTDAGIVGSLYTDMNAYTIATNLLPVGVTQANMTANTYGWICTHGPCIVLQEGAISSGNVIVAAYTTAGAVSRAGLGTSNTSGSFAYPIVGYCMQTSAGNAAGSYITAMLTIE
jgi:hypothetical protein